jgi:hypothetical protein
MARWALWAAGAVGAAGAGAGLALLRRRQAEEPAPAPAAPAAADETPAPPPPPAEDPQQALDAARDRLRARADALREQIEREGEAGPPG